MSETAKIGTAFGAAPSWLLRAGIDDGCKTLYAAMAARAHRRGWICSAWLSELATDCGVKDPQTITSRLKKLEALGAIKLKVKGNGRKPSEYEVLTRPSDAPAEPSSDYEANRSDSTVQAVVTVRSEPYSDYGSSRSETTKRTVVSNAGNGLNTASAGFPRVKQREAEETKKQLSLSKSLSQSPKASERVEEIESEAFDTQPPEPKVATLPKPTGEDQRLALATSAVFTAFVAAAKSPALTGRWKNPTFDQRDRVSRELAPWVADGNLTAASIAKLVKFATTDEFWGSRINKPESFVKNLEGLISAHNRAKEAIRA